MSSPRVRELVRLRIRELVRLRVETQERCWPRPSPDIIEVRRRLLAWADGGNENFDDLYKVAYEAYRSEWNTEARGEEPSSVSAADRVISIISNIHRLTETSQLEIVNDLIGGLSIDTYQAAVSTGSTAGEAIVDAADVRAKQKSSTF